MIWGSSRCFQRCEAYMANPPKPYSVHGIVCKAILAEPNDVRGMVVDVVVVYEFGTTAATHMRLVREAREFIGKTHQDWCSI